MNTKQLLIPLILFILGMILTIIGALFKIQHWPYGSEILIFGSFFEVVGLIILLIILVKFFLKK
jgi:hypothetical protein